MKKILTTPIKAEDLQDIRVGDVIYLTGTLVTCRDVCHRRLIELKRPIPYDLNGKAIFHAGPIVRKNGDKIRFDELSRQLGCQVVEVSALKGEGVMEAAEAAVTPFIGPAPVPIRSNARVPEYIGLCLTQPSARSVVHPTTEPTTSEAAVPRKPQEKKATATTISAVANQAAPCLATSPIPWILPSGSRRFM